MIELTELQHRIVEQNRGQPIPVLDPATQQRFFLVTADWLKHISSLPEEDARWMEDSWAFQDLDDWEDLSVYEGKIEKK